jgi:hypothetical protein
VMSRRTCSAKLEAFRVPGLKPRSLLETLDGAAKAAPLHRDIHGTTPIC